ncbi:L-serine ammonia-lyase, iron-sulfur-dependent, subunit alpha [uncultured Phascolarctobacterium sp.]|uniref:L-serine ammonia-lyase, iron-sulfur-dependent, subunit alpha n=1 Tax=uncultured Phascolarctobacterium sp. TaxID=512296 RepID=UPI002638AA69|nr:L-serine ammonia-lyase, iron-sulfur-dependent, subunit alpha [uncultured Phascolarctobacterium sp.]
MKKEMLSLNSWIEEATSKRQALDDFLLAYNTRELECSQNDLLAKMYTMLEVMEKSVQTGLTGVRSHSGLTGGDAKKLVEAEGGKQFVNLLGDKALDAVIYAMAVGECNAAMGRIVAAPTAGASGVLPGVFFSLKKHCQLSDETLARGLVVAGSIGLVIAERASLAGATGGCQAECGSAAAMAAGAAVSMLGGTPQQIGTAVSIVFKNILGLVCDPVAGLVEVPCIKRNGSCALQALLAAQLALSGIGSFIPADEAIDAMKSVGDSLPCALKETAGGGMAITPTALAWAKQYFAKAHE